MRHTIIYDEKTDARRIYTEGFTNRIFNRREAILLGKYFRHELGYADRKTKTNIIKFSQSHSDFFSEIRSRNIIHLAVKISRNEYRVTSLPVKISEKEYQVINGLDDYKHKQVLFAVLVLSKIDNGRMWISKWGNIREVMFLRITNNKLKEYMTEYYQKGLVEINDSGYQAGNYHVVKFDDSANPDARFNIYRDGVYNLNKTFKELFGENMFQCISCGNFFVKRSHNQKRCHECSITERKNRSRLYVKKHRENLHEIEENVV